MQIQLPVTLIAHSLLAQVLTLVLLSFAMCLALILLTRRSGRMSGRKGDLSAVQAMHDTPTSRLGGFGIFVAVLAGSAFASEPFLSEYWDLIFAGALLFIVGMLEDIGVSISPKLRLLACACASALVIWLAGTWLPRIGVPGFDTLMGYWWLGVPMTLLMTSAVANGFNLIDGVNGLAAITAISAALALSVIASKAGYGDMQRLLLMLAAGIVGFFLLNYPFGLIFLGDAGAYTIGFILSWFGISILLEASFVSPWAILLTMFWPLADTLLAMFRRFRQNRNAMLPDRLHVHQMVMRALEIHVLGRNRRRLANPLSSFILAPFVIAPPLVGVQLWNQNMLAFFSVIIFLVLFFVSYALAFPLLRNFRRQTQGKAKR